MATARQLPADVYAETLSRLPPLKRETLNEAQQRAYDAVTAPRSGRLNLAGIKGPGGVILRAPKLAKPLGDVNRVLRSELGLEARLVELTILATAREMQSQFEWAMHEPVALEVGVPAATIDMIRHGKPLADVPEKEAALIHLAREAVGAKQVTPATYATALALFGEEELLHYSVLIASYAQARSCCASWGRNCTSTSRQDCRSRKSKVLGRRHTCQKPFLQTIARRCGA
jgi:4-carboxymuconolactone decarboxylase